MQYDRAEMPRMVSPQKGTEGAKMRGRNCRIGRVGVAGRNGVRASAQSSGLKHETISVAAFAQIFFEGEHFHPRDPRFTIIGIFAPPAGVSAAERLCRPHIF